MDAKAVAKSGKYYFKYSETDRTVYLSKKKKSSYQATPIAYEFCSNGEQAYYVKQDVENRMDTICKYVFRSGKETQIAELESVKVDDSDGWRLFAVCGDNIYLREDVGGGASEAYMYDLKRKKLSVAQKDFCIGDLYGNYVVAESKYHQDTAAYPITLYKITSSGMKEIKKITEYGCRFSVRFVGEKLYYASYSNYDMSTPGNITLYRCNKDGSNRDKLGSFQDASITWIDKDDVTSKYCYIWTREGRCKYTYNTKKVEKVDF